MAKTKEATAAKPRILIVDDEAPMREGLEQTLGSKKTGYAVSTAESGEDALAILDKESFDVVITDLRMPGISGLDLMVKAKARSPKLPVIVVTAYGDVPTAVDAMKKGAFDFITKPFKIEAVREAVARALIGGGISRDEAKKTADPKEAIELKKSFPGLIGTDPALLKVLKIVKKIAPTKSTVMILGETGTGKELIAKALHRLSKRSKGPFVATSGAIPDTLIETELFGHARGAFTGAVGEKKGYFEAASGGTLFLDEVADLPPKTQVELLRAVQEGEIMRVGEAKPRKVDVRLCAATNKDLRVEIAAGRFREDLFFRLNVIGVTLPPLRERKSDLPELLEFFARRFCEQQGQDPFTWSDEAMDVILRHPWKGNIRELEHFIERTLALAIDPVIGVDDLPDEVREGAASAEADA